MRPGQPLGGPTDPDAGVLETSVGRVTRDSGVKVWRTGARLDGRGSLNRVGQRGTQTVPGFYIVGDTIKRKGSTKINTLARVRQELILYKNCVFFGGL